MPSERALWKDLERQVTVRTALGWNIDRIEVEAMLGGALESVCRVDALDRRAVLTWLDDQIALHGGPVEAAWRARGKQRSRVTDLLVFSRVKLLLATADARSLDCPFWVEAERPFRGRQISERTWQLTFGGGGKGTVAIQGDRQDLKFGGAGRLLLGRTLANGDGIYVGGELGASASFPKDQTGERTALELGIDVVTPVVYRRVLTNAYVEVEGGWLGRATERDWSAFDHGVHVGLAVGARGLRTRFLFPGAALGMSWERTFLSGADMTTIKLGVRVAFDLDL